MPRTEEEKKAWGQKMKAAREARRIEKENGKIVETQAVKPEELIDAFILADEPREGIKITGWEKPCDEFDWEEAPIEEASQRAAEMKREYDRVAMIVARRQSPNDRFKWKCWTILHPEEVPAGKKINGVAVRSACLKGGDGVSHMPKYTDNGNWEVVHGVRTLKPVHICNYTCFAVYQERRVRQKVEAGV